MVLTFSRNVVVDVCQADQLVSFHANIWNIQCLTYDCIAWCMVWGRMHVQSELLHSMNKEDKYCAMCFHSFVVNYWTKIVWHVECWRIKYQAVMAQCTYSISVCTVCPAPHNLSPHIKEPKVLHLSVCEAVLKQ